LKTPDEAMKLIENMAARGHAILRDRAYILMQSYPRRALDKRLQVDWARDAREGPRVLMSLTTDFGPMG